jgi:hypothetical protein
MEEVLGAEMPKQPATDKEVSESAPEVEHQAH